MQLAAAMHNASHSRIEQQGVPAIQHDLAVWSPRDDQLLGRSLVSLEIATQHWQALQASLSWLQALHTVSERPGAL